MSARSTKFAKREIRRAFGEEACQTIADQERAIIALAASVRSAHERSDGLRKDLVALAADHALLKQGMRHFEALTLWGRFCWLFTGQ